MSKKRLTTGLLAAALLAGVVAPATARDPVTEGDVRAQFEAVESGGTPITGRKGFETTIPPAGALLHSIRPIQPFFDGRHYCYLDWHLITIALFLGKGDFGLSTVAEVKRDLDSGEVTFRLDGVDLPAEEETAVKTITTTDGEVFWKAWGTFYPPGSLAVGSHRLSGVAVFPGFSFPLDSIRFHIDSEGEGTCA